MSLFIDLSEFLTIPMKTGIQRIGGELCRYLHPDAAVPVRLESDRLLALSPTLIEVIGRYFREPGDAAIGEINRLSSFENGSPIKISSGDTLLVPEIFAEQRAKFFLEMSEEELSRCKFIVYDLLPLTHPEYFPSFVPPALSGYFRVIRQAVHCGFISEYTRDVYYARLRRRACNGGVVLPLGGDALGERVRRPALNRPLTFSVLGTVEPRKNHELILDAFEPLLRQIKGLNLSFIGKMGWVEPELARRVQTLSADENSGFRFFRAPDDNAIRQCIEESRATIYLSAAEGYGLPPVESLWLGTPVIASTTIPSLQSLEPKGIEYVDPLNLNNLRQTVQKFMEDDYVNQKIEEIVSLDLPTWREFTREVIRWCSES